MRKLLLIALMLTTGLLVGCGQKEETGAAVEKVKKVKWKMASTFPGSLVQIGTLGVRLQNEVSKCAAVVHGGLSRMDARRTLVTSVVGSAR